MATKTKSKTQAMEAVKIFDLQPIKEPETFTFTQLELDIHIEQAAKEKAMLCSSRIVSLEAHAKNKAYHQRAMWEGKFHVVRHENNELRKQVRKLRNQIKNMEAQQVDDIAPQELSESTWGFNG